MNIILIMAWHATPTFARTPGASGQNYRTAAVRHKDRERGNYGGREGMLCCLLARALLPSFSLFPIFCFLWEFSLLLLFALLYCFSFHFIFLFLFHILLCHLSYDTQKVFAPDDDDDDDDSERWQKCST